MKTHLLSSFILISAVSLTSCEREDDTDSMSTPKTYVTLSGNVLHHDAPIPEARVFIKYNTSDFPGTDTSAYDAGTVANTAAHYEFKNIPSGKHYLFSTGYDPGLKDSVFGGIPVNLPEHKTIQEINVPVTE